MGADVLDAMFKLGSRTDEPVLVPGFSKDWQLAAFHNETFEGCDNGCLMEMHRRNFMNVIDYPKLTTVAFMGSPDLLVNMSMTMFNESIPRISRSQMAIWNLDQLISVERVSTDFLVQKIAVFLELAPVLYAQMLKSLQYTMTVVLTWDFVEYWVAFERVLIDFGLEIVTIALDFSYREHTDLVHETVGIILLFFCIIQLEEIKCNEMMEQKIRIAFYRLVKASKICQTKKHFEHFLHKQKIRNAFSGLVVKYVLVKECNDITDNLGYFTVDLKKQYDFQLKEKSKVELDDEKQMTWDMTHKEIHRYNMHFVIAELRTTKNFN